MTRRIQFAILAALLASAAGFAGGTFWPGGAPLSPDVLAALAGMVGAVLVVALFRDSTAAPGLGATEVSDLDGASLSGQASPTAGSQPVSGLKSAPAASKGFFDDLDLGPVVALPEERGPSLDSVMFALAAVDGEAPSGSQRAPVTVRPTVAPVVAASPTVTAPAAASTPTPASTAVSANVPRPIDRVASVSPFGPGTEHLKVEGSLTVNAAEGTLGDLASAFEMADDQNDAVEAGRLEMARSGLSSIRARHSAGTNSMRGPSAATAAPRSAPVAATTAPAPTSQRPAQSASVAAATGRIESVALMSEWFGTDDAEVMPQAAAPRSASAPTARPVSSPFAPASASSRPVPVEMVAPSTPVPARNGRDEAAALNGLRSNRGSSSRPAVPVSAMASAWVPSLNKAPSAASAASALPELDNLNVAPATPIRRDRATSEQRVITARLQMGMLKNRTDSQQEFKKGQVPTPRKNAPGNLIMLSKRPDDFAEGTSSDDEIRQLYREFVSALNRCGRSTEIVQFQSFAQRIQSQRTKVRSQYQGVRINMAVRVTDGRPKIVMRPAM